MQLPSLYVRTAVLASLILFGSACHTAQHPAALLPATSAPPALKPPTVAAMPNPSQQEPVAPKPEEVPAQKSAQAETSPAPTQPSDAVGDLISRVDREYQNGLDNYRAGKSDEARQNFDNALNDLLGSNYDVRSDGRLEAEFNRIVNGVNDLYPGGTGETEQAAQESQQKAEPAPIDETNDIAPAPTASAKAKAEAEIGSTHSDLPLMMTDQVAGYITYFSGRGRGVFERAYTRSGRYRGMILSTLRQEGVPQDLIYLAQAESGFHPLAVSRVGARGIWQFMAGRGRGYGLSHSMYVDDRQDPEKSTRAAARHLKDLYNQFGDWYLAMAAYNSGPGRVQAAVKRTGYADFWELYRRNALPKETRNYVPIILAVTIMTKNPSQYGLDGLTMDRPADFDTVTVNYPVDLRLVAECVNSTAAELQDMNPSLLRVSTPHAGSFELHLPAGTKDLYQTAIASIPPDKRLSWRYHQVGPGDTVMSLARTYHTTAKQIEEANHLDGPELEADAKLVIPVAPGKHPDTDGATYARRITRYKVHRGDTVASVAENFGIPAIMLKRWNGLRGNSLSGRRVVALHLPVSPSAREAEVSASKSKSKKRKTETAVAKPPVTKSAQIERLKTETSVVHHKVKAGETLYSIANAYRTTVAALKRENRDIANLRPGMILTIQIAR
ncbi:MAG: LysM peptidoglycan-binding domain-containing protein [Candidatus Sulfotelmatobacter sp.]